MGCRNNPFHSFKLYGALTSITKSHFILPDMVNRPYQSGMCVLYMLSNH